MTKNAEGKASPVSGKGSRGRYPKGILRRQQILDRTVEVFADLGFEGTSLRAIGEAIGVSHAALRRYFETREDLFLEVLREKDRQALAAAHGSGTAPGFAAMSANYILKTPGLMALRHSMVARALEPSHGRSREFFRDRYRSIRQEARLILQSARDQGTVRDDIPLDTAASLLVAAMDGLSTQALLDTEADMSAGMALLEQLLTPEAAEAPHGT